MSSRQMSNHNSSKRLELFSPEVKAVSLLNKSSCPPTFKASKRFKD